jgi:hypothetical protein
MKLPAVLILSLLSYVLNAQPVSSVKVLQKENSVLLSFVLEQGFTCNDIFIYRSEDGINFSEAGTIPGICGSASEAVLYSYTDVNPTIEKLNCYYIEPRGLMPSQTACTYVFDPLFTEIRAFPNPLIDHVRIYSPLLNQKNKVVRIISLEGKIISEENIDCNPCDLNYESLQPGVFILEILSAAGASRVRLVKN